MLIDPMSSAANNTYRTKYPALIAGTPGSMVTVGVSLSVEMEDEGSYSLTAQDAIDLVISAIEGARGAVGGSGEVDTSIVEDRRSYTDVALPATDGE